MIMAPLFGSKTWGLLSSQMVVATYLLVIFMQISAHDTKISIKPNLMSSANHQGAFDIFLTYGFLNHNIVWMQKHSLRSLPLVGYASKMAGHVFVNNTNATTRAFTLKEAISKVKDGVSIVIFPEGARTLTGKMRQFKKGAYSYRREVANCASHKRTFDVLKGHINLKPGKLGVCNTQTYINRKYL